MHWLDRYGTDYHRWQKVATSSSETWYRPIGIVESMFNTDGVGLEGRADINTLLEADLSMSQHSTISRHPEALRHKILLAWTVLRFQNPLLTARTVCRGDVENVTAERAERGGGPDMDKFFLVRKPASVTEMLEESEQMLNFVEDDYAQVDVEDFYTHVMNTGRVFDSRKNLARLFILPLQPLAQAPHRVRFSAISVVAHEIADAISIYRYHGQFLDLVNMPTSTLEARAAQLCSPATTTTTTNDPYHRLPQAQEDLYPPIRGSPARQRWFWAITRILRHVRRPPPPSFPNPLRRPLALHPAEKMPARYAAILTYSSTPPLNTYSAAATLSPSASSRIQSLCRAAGASIGSGAFALTAMVMMLLHERELEEDHPHTPAPTPPANPLPFTSFFPLNPRPFLTEPTTGHESSLVIAFSDGLTLPFLPSHLPLEPRFRLLARLADRQLRVYQKRRRGVDQQQQQQQQFMAQLGSRSAGQMLPQLYLYTVEQEGVKARAVGGEGSGNGQGRGWGDVQGGYPVRVGGNGTGMGATCGVSSVGDRRGVMAAPLVGEEERVRTTAAGEEDTSVGEEDSLRFDFVDIRCTVRARDQEFLVGSAGNRGGWSFNVSFDGCFIEPGRVRGEWKRLMEGLFEEGGLEAGVEVEGGTRRARL